MKKKAKASDTAVKKKLLDIPKARSWKALKSIPAEGGMPKWSIEKLKEFSNMVGTDIGWGIRGVKVYLSAQAFDWEFFERNPLWSFSPRHDKKYQEDYLEAVIVTDQVYYRFRMDISTNEGRQHLKTLVKFFKKRKYTKSKAKLLEHLKRYVESHRKQSETHAAIARSEQSQEVSLTKTLKALKG